jgi:hypothetical protein
MNKLSALQVLEGIQESHRRTALKISPPERDRTMKARGRFEEDEQGYSIFDALSAINEVVIEINRRTMVIEQHLAGRETNGNDSGSKNNERSDRLDGSSHSETIKAYEPPTKPIDPIHSARRSGRPHEQNTDKVREPIVR